MIEEEKEDERNRPRNASCHSVVMRAGIDSLKSLTHAHWSLVTTNWFPEPRFSPAQRNSCWPLVNETKTPGERLFWW